MKTQRTTEDPANPDVPPFGVVFDSHLAETGDVVLENRWTDDAVTLTDASAISSSPEGEVADDTHAFALNAGIPKVQTTAINGDPKVPTTPDFAHETLPSNTAMDAEASSASERSTLLRTDPVFGHPNGQLSAGPEGQGRQSPVAPETRSISAIQPIAPSHGQPNASGGPNQRSFPSTPDSPINVMSAETPDTTSATALPAQHRAAQFDPSNISRTITAPLSSGAPGQSLTVLPTQGVALTEGGAPTGQAYSQTGAQSSVTEALNATAPILPAGAQAAVTPSEPAQISGREVRQIGNATPSLEQPLAGGFGQRPTLPVAPPGHAPDLLIEPIDIGETATIHDLESALDEKSEREFRVDFDRFPPRSYGPVMGLVSASHAAIEVSGFTLSGTQSNAGPNLAAIGAEIGVGMDLYPALQLSTSGSGATPSVAPSIPAGLPPNAPNLVAQQIAATLQENGSDPGHPIEIALDPPELGRVRMHIAELAGVLTLTIHAERPETAELMRRHLDLLAQEFSDAGVDAPSVRVSQDGPNDQTGGQDTREHANSGTEEAAGAATSTATQTQTTNRPGALDLRL